MPILLIALIVAGGFWAKNTLEEVPFAMRGKTSPRRQLQMEKFRAKQGNSERRYSFARYLADLWAQRWKEALKVRLDTTDHHVRARTEKAIRAHERRVDRRNRRWARRDDRRDRRHIRRTNPVAPQTSGTSVPTTAESAPPAPAEPAAPTSQESPPSGAAAPAATSNRPKENTVPANTGETTDIERLTAELKADVAEATAEHEDAAAAATRAQDELGRVETRVASLTSVKLPEPALAAIRQQQEPAQAAAIAAKARAGAAEAKLAAANAALAQLAPHQGIQDLGSRAGGVADGSFYGQQQTASAS